MSARSSAALANEEMPEPRVALLAREGVLVGEMTLEDGLLVGVMDRLFLSGQGTQDGLSRRLQAPKILPRFTEFVGRVSATIAFCLVCASAHPQKKSYNLGEEVETIW